MITTTYTASSIASPSDGNAGRLRVGA